MSEGDATNLDETEMSEITIQPDGRIYVFGASLPILQILQSLQPNDERIAAILRAANPAKKNMLDSEEVRT